MPMTLSKSDQLIACDLLRGLVFWEKPNSEIEARLVAMHEAPKDFQKLARDLSGLTVPDEIARVIFSFLVAHVQDLREVQKRSIGISEVDPVRRTKTGPS